MAFKDRFRDIQPAAGADYVKPVTQPPSVIGDIKSKLFLKVSLIPVWFEYSEAEKKHLISAFLETYLKENDISLTEDEKFNCVNQLSNAVYGFGELDSLLEDEGISSITIMQNQSVLIEQNGEKIYSDVKLENLPRLCERLAVLSGMKKDVRKFSFKNLVITMSVPPVSDIFIYIKKLNRENTDFEYLLENHIIDENIYSFLISLINDKKSFLISGAAESGKSSYADSFLSAVSGYTLMQECSFINAKSFVCGNLSSDEFENLLGAVLQKGEDYLICDLNSGYYCNENVPLISTIRAESSVSAITRLSGESVAKRKLTEKQAKAEIGKRFDYLIQLDKNLYISSIVELSLNKAGSLVMNEILKREDGKYSYDFPEIQIEETIQPDAPASSFKSRFR